MRLGALILPDARWVDAAPRWTRAEQLGLDHAWTYDHLAWRTLRDSDWFGAVPTLTAAACTTSTIRLGTLVASTNFRHPVPFAKELMTLDDVSSGRVTAGIGAGAEDWDAVMLGGDTWSLRERADRFEEFVAVLDAVLRRPSSSYEGRFYSARDARAIPGCVQLPRVPFAIAATGARGMRVAARHAAVWVTTGDRHTPGLLDARDGAAMVAAQIERLDGACDAIGRDPASIGKLVLTGPQLAPCTDTASSLRDAIARYEDVGVTDLVFHWPRAEPPFAGSVAAFEAAIAGAIGS